ncbi:hypothetical protein [Crossiella sp. CA198]|uniref:hypothetical protein n=1 Tax=Crossiella sp. CA198 TaxID=3455607 RepID=UPI003F8D743F
MSTFTRYRWLPEGAFPLNLGEPHARPAGRYLTLGVAALVLMAVPMWLPRWAWLLIGAGLAVWATLGFGFAQRPQYPTSWLVRQPTRLGRVDSGDKDRTGPAPGVVTWLRSGEIQLVQRSWATAATAAHARFLDATGLAETTSVADWDEDEEFEYGTGESGYLLRDERAAFAVHGYELSDESGTGLLPFGWLGVARDRLPVQRHGPNVTRVGYDDVRALARVGAAPAHRLEAAFAGHAQPSEVDLVLDLGLPRGWPSILDTLPPAEVRAMLAPARIAVLRAELLAQGARDLAWEQERDVVTPVSPEWTERWLSRLDNISAAGHPPELTPGAWPELSGTAYTGLLLAATATDSTDRPLRPLLGSLGVPTESAAQRLTWAPGRVRWNLLDRANLVACYGFSICAGAAFSSWLDG